jgi:hypothetical protein
MLPQASASPSPVAGTIAVYGALLFAVGGSSGGGSGGGGGIGGGGGSSGESSGRAGVNLMNAFAQQEAVDAIAAAIKTSLVESLVAAAATAAAASGGAPAAAAAPDIGVTIITITDVATGNAIYSVANPTSARRRQRRLSGAAGSMGIKVDFVTQVPPTISAGASVASTLAAAVAPSGAGAAIFQAAVIANVVTNTGGSAALAASFAGAGVAALALAPSIPSASPAPSQPAARTASASSVPIGAAIGGAVSGLVVVAVAGIAARKFVLRRLRSIHGSSKVAPATTEQEAAVAMASTPGPATLSSSAAAIELAGNPPGATNQAAEGAQV